MKQILNQFSKAILLAASGDRSLAGFIPHALRDLARLESLPLRLTEIAYRWCSAIYANREKFEDWESLLLVCLELGFHHLDTRQPYTPVTLIHTEHHCALVEVVFKSQRSEAIADFLHAWTTGYSLPDQAGEMVGICAGHLVGLHNLVPFSPRLRQLVIRFVEIAGYKGFEGVGVEKLTELLNHLDVTAEEIVLNCSWASLLLGVIQSPEGTRHLSHRHWEFLVELIVSQPWLESRIIRGREIIKSLTDAQEWDKLECWIGVVWMSFEMAGITEEELEHSMLLLFHHRPGAAPKLEQVMKRWSQECREDIPESFQRILVRAQEAVQRQVAP